MDVDDITVNGLDTSNNAPYSFSYGLENELTDDLYQQIFLEPNTDSGINKSCILGNNSYKMCDDMPNFPSNENGLLDLGDSFFSENICFDKTSKPVADKKQNLSDSVLLKDPNFDSQSKIGQNHLSSNGEPNDNSDTIPGNAIPENSGENIPEIEQKESEDVEKKMEFLFNNNSDMTEDKVKVKSSNADEVMIENPNSMYSLSSQLLDELKDDAVEKSGNEKLPILDNMSNSSELASMSISEKERRLREIRDSLKQINKAIADHEATNRKPINSPSKFPTISDVRGAVVIGDVDDIKHNKTISSKDVSKRLNRSFDQGELSDVIVIEEEELGSSKSNSFQRTNLPEKSDTSSKQDKKIETRICSDCESEVDEDENLHRCRKGSPTPMFYICSVCSQTFKNEKKLQTHMTVHNKTKYGCSVLSLENHPNIGLFCEICSKKFITFIALNGHMVNHVIEKPFYCPYCKKSYKAQSTLLQHIEMHMDDYMYRCNHCCKIFDSKYGCLEHTYKIHRNKGPDYLRFLILDTLISEMKKEMTKVHDKHSKRGKFIMEIYRLLRKRNTVLGPPLLKEEPSFVSNIEKPRFTSKSVDLNSNRNTDSKIFDNKNDKILKDKNNYSNSKKEVIISSSELSDSDMDNDGEEKLNKQKMIKENLEIGKRNVTSDSETEKSDFNRLIDHLGSIDNAIPIKVQKPKKSAKIVFAKKFDIENVICDEDVNIDAVQEISNHEEIKEPSSEINKNLQSASDSNKKNDVSDFENNNSDCDSKSIENATIDKSSKEIDSKETVETPKLVEPVTNRNKSTNLNNDVQQNCIKRIFQSFGTPKQYGPAPNKIMKSENIYQTKTTERKVYEKYVAIKPSPPPNRSLANIFDFCKKSVGKTVVPSIITSNKISKPLAIPVPKKIARRFFVNGRRVKNLKSIISVENVEKKIDDDCFIIMEKLKKPPNFMDDYSYKGGIQLKNARRVTKKKPRKFSVIKSNAEEKGYVVIKESNRYDFLTEDDIVKHEIKKIVHSVKTLPVCGDVKPLNYKRRQNIIIPYQLNNNFSKIKSNSCLLFEKNVQEKEFVSHELKKAASLFGGLNQISDDQNIEIFTEHNMTITTKNNVVEVIRIKTDFKDDFVPPEWFQQKFDTDVPADVKRKIGSLCKDPGYQLKIYEKMLEFMTYKDLHCDTEFANRQLLGPIVWKNILKQSNLIIGKDGSTIDTVNYIKTTNSFVGYLTKICNLWIEAIVKDDLGLFKNDNRHNNNFEEVASEKLSSILSKAKDNNTDHIDEKNLLGPAFWKEYLLNYHIYDLNRLKNLSNILNIDNVRDKMSEENSIVFENEFGIKDKNENDETNIERKSETMDVDEESESKHIHEKMDTDDQNHVAEKCDDSELNLTPVDENDLIPENDSLSIHGHIMSADRHSNCKTSILKIESNLQPQIQKDYSYSPKIDTIDFSVLKNLQTDNDPSLENIGFPVSNGGIVYNKQGAITNTTSEPFSDLRLPTGCLVIDLSKNNRINLHVLRSIVYKNSEISDEFEECFKDVNFAILSLDGENIHVTPVIDNDIMKQILPSTNMCIDNNVPSGSQNLDNFRSSQSKYDEINFNDNGSVKYVYTDTIAGMTEEADCHSTDSYTNVGEYVTNLVETVVEHLMQEKIKRIEETNKSEIGLIIGAETSVVDDEHKMECDEVVETPISSNESSEGVLETPMVLDDSEGTCYKDNLEKLNDAECSSVTNQSEENIPTLPDVKCTTPVGSEATFKASVEACNNDTPVVSSIDDCETRINANLMPVSESQENVENDTLSKELNESPIESEGAVENLKEENLVDYFKNAGSVEDFYEKINNTAADTMVDNIFMQGDNLSSNMTDSVKIDQKETPTNDTKTEIIENESKNEISIGNDGRSETNNDDHDQDHESNNTTNSNEVTYEINIGDSIINITLENDSTRSLEDIVEIIKQTLSYAHFDLQNVETQNLITEISNGIFYAHSQVDAGNSLIRNEPSDNDSNLTTEQNIDLNLTKENTDFNLTNDNIDSSLTNENIDSNLTKENIVSNLINVNIDTKLTHENIDSNLTNETIDSNLTKENVNIDLNLTNENIDLNLTKESIDSNLTTENIDSNLENDNIDSNLKKENMVSNVNIDPNLTNENIDSNLTKENIHDKEKFLNDYPINAHITHEIVTPKSEKIDKEVIDDESNVLSKKRKHELDNFFDKIMNSDAEELFNFDEDTFCNGNSNKKQKPNDEDNANIQSDKDFHCEGPSKMTEQRRPDKFEESQKCFEYERSTSEDYSKKTKLKFKNLNYNEKDDLKSKLVGVGNDASSSDESETEDGQNDDNNDTESSNSEFDTGQDENSNAEKDQKTEKTYLLSLCTNCGLLINLALGLDAMIPEDDFPCNICLEILDKKDLLITHYHNDHYDLKESYTCSLCNEKFKFWYAYCQHFKNHVSITSSCDECQGLPSP